MQPQTVSSSSKHHDAFLTTTALPSPTGVTGQLRLFLSPVRVYHYRQVKHLFTWCCLLALLFLSRGYQGMQQAYEGKDNPAAGISVTLGHFNPAHLGLHFMPHGCYGCVTKNDNATVISQGSGVLWQHHGSITGRAHALWGPLELGRCHLGLLPPLVGGMGLARSSDAAGGCHSGAEPALTRIAC